MTIIIPSKSASNLVPCVDAIRLNDPGCDIIVIDDGLDVEAEELERVFFQLRPFPALRLNGVKPFIFARNVNIGIKAAREDDVVILNDDALLKTPHGFSMMESLSQIRDYGPYGVIAASCNNVGNLNQHNRARDVHSEGLLRDEPRMVCFVCVFIPRSTINTVGLLDERFVGYGCDDDDYCLRVRKAGLKIGIFDGCYVDHGSLKSSFRGEPGAGGDYRPNLELFREKWGAGNHDL